MRPNIFSYLLLYPFVQPHTILLIYTPNFNFIYLIITCNSSLFSLSLCSLTLSLLIEK